MNGLIVRGKLRKPADYDDNKSDRVSDNSDRHSESSDEDIGSDMEAETLKSADHLDQGLIAGGFTNKHLTSGVLFALRTLGNRYLYATTIKKGKPYRTIRPNFIKNVLREGTRGSLMQKLRSFPGVLPRKAFPFGSEEIKSLIRDTFTSNIERNNYENGFSSTLSFALMHIARNIRAPDGKPIFLNDAFNKAFIAWGLIPRKAPEGSEEVLDIKSGCIGRCDYMIRNGSTLKPFAVFELKLLKGGAKFDIPWYMQAKPWVLQTYNSFIGSNAEVGGAFAPDGFQLIWRVPARTRLTTGVRMEVEGSDEIETYNYFSINPRYLEPINEENVSFLADFFVELVRIGCTLENPELAREASVSQTVEDTDQENASPQLPPRNVSPRRKIPKTHHEENKGTKRVRKVCITQIKGENLEVFVVKPEEVFTDSEINFMQENEEEFEAEEMEMEGF
jgi:hypothetical protein